MLVAKMQRRKKPSKIEQRNVPGPEWEPRVKQTALLASPINIGLAQGEEKKRIKRGAKTEPISSSGLAGPHISRKYFPLLAK